MFYARPKITQGPKISQVTWKERETCTALVYVCVYHAHAHIFIFQRQRWGNAKLNTNYFHSFDWSNGRWSKSPSSLFLANHLADVWRNLFLEILAEGNSFPLCFWGISVTRNWRGVAGGTMTDQIHNKVSKLSLGVTIYNVIQSAFKERVF